MYIEKICVKMIKYTAYGMKLYLIEFYPDISSPPYLAEGKPNFLVSGSLFSQYLLIDSNSVLSRYKYLLEVNTKVD